MNEQSSGGNSYPIDLVDVHSHIYTPSYVEFLTQRLEPPQLHRTTEEIRFLLFPGDEGVVFSDEFTSVDAKLAFMDRHRISHSVLSLGNPWMDVCPGEGSVGLAAAVNDEIAAIVALGAGRLLGMGVVPNHRIDDAVQSVHDVHRLGLSGLIVGTAVAGEALDSPHLDPVWALAAARSLPIFVHPQAGLAADLVRGYGQAMTLALSFPFETTAAIARMSLSGVFQRHPGLVVVAAHGGGTFPYLSGRLARAVAVDGSAAASAASAALPDGLYVDSVLFSAAALNLCTDVLGPGRVLFGSDHPYPIADTAASRDAVLNSRYSDEISYLNAIRLFFPDQDRSE